MGAPPLRPDSFLPWAWLGFGELGRVTLWAGERVATSAGNNSNPFAPLRCHLPGPWHIQDKRLNPPHAAAGFELANLFQEMPHLLFLSFFPLWLT
eukprot:13527962-Alexandrium_andersonii.AAC.1